MKTNFLPLIIIVFLFNFTSSFSKVYYVPDNYKNLQTALDSVSEGDTVLVREGTYYENIKFNGKNIVMASLYFTTNDTSYISKTIIDGGRKASVITFQKDENNKTRFSGFTIQNGNSDFGCGIYLLSGSPLISHCIIRNNIYIPSLLQDTGAVPPPPPPCGTTSMGGGIYCENSHAMISNCSILNNSSINGGGIGCNYNSFPVVIDCIIKNNIGGGVYFDELNGSGAKFINSIISENYDGGVYVGYMNHPSFINCDIINNHRFGISVNNQIYYKCKSNKQIKDSKDSVVRVINSIIWGDSISFICNGDEKGILLVMFSCIKDSLPKKTKDSIGNLFKDPLLTSDLQLNSNSPCVNAGIPDTIGFNLPSKDLSGKARISDKRIDMGAYEYQVLDLSPEFLNRQAFRLYPNPLMNNSKLNIDFRNMSKNNYKIDIYDALGNNVYEKSDLKEQHETISLRGLGKGMYFYFIRNKDQNPCYGKLIVY